MAAPRSFSLERIATHNRRRLANRGYYYCSKRWTAHHSRWPGPVPERHRIGQGGPGKLEYLSVGSLRQRCTVRELSDTRSFPKPSFRQLREFGQGRAARAWNVQHRRDRKSVV